MKEFINQLMEGKNLSIKQAAEAMNLIMSGKATKAQIAGFITALRMKGETVEEITGCAQVMRDKATEVKPKEPIVVDTCGTGGDGVGTFNISTTTALVIAGAGVPVAKHGNRSVSSRSGSADVLEALGVNLELSSQEVAKAVDEIGIGFLYAPKFHKAMKHAIGPRKELGIRTVFNILGPLTNPARAKRQVLGVYDPELTSVLARVLGNLGVEKAFVVHGAGGLDEISILGETKVSYLCDGKVEELTIHPNDFGLSVAELEAIKGGTVQDNAEITLEILKGESGPTRDIILLNSAAGLLIADQVDNLEEGVELAAKIIDSGKALEKLEELISYTKKVYNEQKSGYKCS
ncbi:anthranilate phosphoribosyltransferase [Candidatus Frackibacter sp. WG13]|uniref:anthranilate phosphoribosyltransferase n=1 Tax=unclassified Candidatus Frackibacter TaxID=2648818 RepID=UPI0008888D3E|nr:MULTISPECIES: anthranilate phosphoribosyltransferase [unclassified Candidatus Frackibacter]SDC16841.1 anthranilate phosphoribosyltransferase [Candidatus Frackibacter sp. WG11]SFL47354.1 anthranilate phosphoribosyltransferase [Candidatus Frackibacter sp. WG13]